MWEGDDTLSWLTLRVRSFQMQFSGTTPDKYETIQIHVAGQYRRQESAGRIGKAEKVKIQVMQKSRID